MIHGCMNKEVVSRSGELILSLPTALVRLILAKCMKFWCLYFNCKSSGQREDERKMSLSSESLEGISLLTLSKRWRHDLIKAYKYHHNKIIPYAKDLLHLVERA